MTHDGANSVATTALTADVALDRATLAALLMLVLLAGVVRLAGLNAPDGQLDANEARMVVAADGVLQSGLPVMPSGRIYTRGLLNSYAIGSTFALLGRSDFAARLPSALAGVLLVPLVFLLTRTLSTPAAGLAAAGFAALAEPLIDYSRSAWVPSIFLLLFVLAAYCFYRGFEGRHAGWQIAGSGCFLLALLSYEFAVLLLGGLGLYLGLCLIRRDWGWYRGGSTLLALGILAGGLMIFGALAVTLRVGTVAGSLSEVQFHAAPGLNFRGANFYLQRLLPEYWPIVLAALLGLPLLARARLSGATFLAGLLTVVLFAPVVLLRREHLVRYILPALPLTALLAAAGTQRLCDMLGRRIGLAGRRRSALTGLALAAVFGWALQEDVWSARRLLGRSPQEVSWVQTLRGAGLQPNDLLLGDVSTKLQFYFGHAEFEFRVRDYERYAYEAPDGLRFIYTGSAFISRQGDFERLVEQQNPGRTLWVISRGNAIQMMADEIDPALWPSLVRSADKVLRTPDGWVLLRITLPRPARPA